MHDILNFDIPADFFKQMLMVPKPEGTQSLFIDKIDRYVDMGDLRNPECRHADHRCNAIADDHPRMHATWDVRNNR